MYTKLSHIATIYIQQQRFRSGACAETMPLLEQSVHKLSQLEAENLALREDN
ncbi:hypothetical protein YC2023_053347 [Brassica napus]